MNNKDLDFDKQIGKVFSNKNSFSSSSRPKGFDLNSIKKFNAKPSIGANPMKNIKSVSPKNSFGTQNFNLPKFQNNNNLNNKFKPNFNTRRHPKI